MALTNCPHCDRELRTGAPYNSHERACAKKHGVEPTAKANAYTDKRGQSEGSSDNGKIPPPPDPKPVVGQVGDWLLWDRGTYRGWAIGAVSKRTPEILLMDTPHLGRISWSVPQFEDDVKAGRVFLINPDDICLAMANQIKKLQSAEWEAGNSMLKAAIENLFLAAYQLRQYREIME